MVSPDCRTIMYTLGAPLKAHPTPPGQCVRPYTVSSSHSPSPAQLSSRHGWPKRPADAMAGWVRGTVLEGPNSRLHLDHILTRECLATLSVRRPFRCRVYSSPSSSAAFEKRFLKNLVKEVRKSKVVERMLATSSRIYDRRCQWPSLATWLPVCASGAQICYLAPPRN